jgi:hypothetical protein
MADTPKFEVPLDLDHPVHSDEIYVSVPEPGKIGIRVSPGVEAWTLAVLRPVIGLAVADAIRAHRETSRWPAAVPDCGGRRRLRVESSGF